MNDLIELGWRSQVLFIGGYLAYAIAYSGRRDHHRPTDTIGILLCFGGVGLLSIGLIEQFFFPNDIGPKTPDETHTPNNYALGVASVATSLLAAIIWRGFLNDWVLWLLSHFSKSDEDGLPTAWATIIQKQGLQYAQLVVTLRSGTTYESYPLGEFNSLPNGPCVLGSDGAIGMYVTAITEVEGVARKVANLADDDGHRITYIPASEISEVDLRRMKR